MTKSIEAAQAFVVEGTDVSRSREVLDVLLADLHRDEASATVQPRELMVTAVDQLLAGSTPDHAACRDSLRWVLQYGGKFGVTGVAAGDAATAADLPGGCAVIRELLVVGRPLQYEPTR